MRLERSRRLNLLRQRKSREADRIQAHVLQEQCNDLRMQQEKLLRVGCELEVLLHKAEVMVGRPL